MTNKKIVGNIGEQLVSLLLVDRGLVVIDRNWHCLYGEIDIIAKRSEESYFFFEIKTRSFNEHSILGIYGSGLTSVNHHKYAKIIKAISCWLNHNRRDWDEVENILALEVLIKSSSLPAIEKLLSETTTSNSQIISTRLLKLIKYKYIIVNCIEIGV